MFNFHCCRKCTWKVLFYQVFSWKFWNFTFNFLYESNRILTTWLQWMVTSRRHSASSVYLWNMRGSWEGCWRTDSRIPRPHPGKVSSSFTFVFVIIWNTIHYYFIKCICRLFWMTIANTICFTCLYGVFAFKCCTCFVSSNQTDWILSCIFCDVLIFLVFAFKIICTIFGNFFHPRVKWHYSKVWVTSVDLSLIFAVTLIFGDSVSNWNINYLNVVYQ